MSIITDLFEDDEIKKDKNGKNISILNNDRGLIKFYHLDNITKHEVKDRLFLSFDVYYSLTKKNKFKLNKQTIELNETYFKKRYLVEIRDRYSGLEYYDALSYIFKVLYNNGRDLELYLINDDLSKKLDDFKSILASEDVRFSSWEDRIKYFLRELLNESYLKEGLNEIKINEFNENSLYQSSIKWSEELSKYDTYSKQIHLRLPLSNIKNIKFYDKSIDFDMSKVYNKNNKTIKKEG